MDKINYGPCKICGGPILYLGSNFCGPRCNSVALQPVSTIDTKIQVSRPNFAPTPVSLSKPEPEPELVLESVVVPELVQVPEYELIVQELEPTSEPELTITLEPIASVPEEVPEEVPEFMVVAKLPKKPKPPKKPKITPLEPVLPPKLEEPVRKKLYL